MEGTSPHCDSEEEVFWGPVTARELELVWRRKRRDNVQRDDNVPKSSDDQAKDDGACSENETFKTESDSREIEELKNLSLNENPETDFNKFIPSNLKYIDEDSFIESEGAVNDSNAEGSLKNIPGKVSQNYYCNKNIILVSDYSIISSDGELGGEDTKTYAVLKPLVQETLEPSHISEFLSGSSSQYENDETCALGDADMFDDDSQNVERQHCRVPETVDNKEIMYADRVTIADDSDTDSGCCENDKISDRSSRVNINQIMSPGIFSVTSGEYFDARTNNSAFKDNPVLSREEKMNTSCESYKENEISASESVLTFQSASDNFVASGDKQESEITDFPNSLEHTGVSLGAEGNSLLSRAESSHESSETIKYFENSDSFERNLELEKTVFNVAEKDVDKSPILTNETKPVTNDFELKNTTSTMLKSSDESNDIVECLANSEKNYYIDEHTRNESHCNLSSGIEPVINRLDLEHTESVVSKLSYESNEVIKYLDNSEKNWESEENYANMGGINNSKSSNVTSETEPDNFDTESFEPVILKLSPESNKTTKYSGSAENNLESEVAVCSREEMSANEFPSHLTNEIEPVVNNFDLKNKSVINYDKASTNKAIEYLMPSTETAHSSALNFAADDKSESSTFLVQSEKECMTFEGLDFASLCPKRPAVYKKPLNVDMRYREPKTICLGNLNTPSPKVDRLKKQPSKLPCKTETFKPCLKPARLILDQNLKAAGSSQKNISSSKSATKLPAIGKSAVPVPNTKSQPFKKPSQFLEITPKKASGRTLKAPTPIRTPNATNRSHLYKNIKSPVAGYIHGSSPLIIRNVVPSVTSREKLEDLKLSQDLDVNSENIDSSNIIVNNASNFLKPVCHFRSDKALIVEKTVKTQLPKMGKTQQKILCTSSSPQPKFILHKGTFKAPVSNDKLQKKLVFSPKPKSTHLNGFDPDASYAAIPNKNEAEISVHETYKYDVGMNK